MEQQRAILDYHERSKHQLRRYAPGPGYLDWANQPDPFRTYAGAPRIALALAADEIRTRFADVRAGRLPAAAPVTRETIGVLLELSLAISAWKSFGGTSWALRCNPSSGNLHPTEGYIVADLPGLEGGVYHYVSRDHLLEQRARWADPAPRIERGVIVGLASIYWREAWKYGMRAFRYCQHDCGHAIAAVSYAAASLGWQTRLLDSAGDDDVAALLGLDRLADAGPAEREEPDCLLWVGVWRPSRHRCARRCSAYGGLGGTPEPIERRARGLAGYRSRARSYTQTPHRAGTFNCARQRRTGGTEARSRSEHLVSSAAQRGRLRRRDFDLGRRLLHHARAAAAARGRTAVERVALGAASASRPVRASRRGTGARALRVPAR